MPLTLKFILTLLSSLALSACVNDSSQIKQAGASNKQLVSSNQNSANLIRIKIATVGANDVAATTTLYSQWLNHKVIERGLVSQAMADSWGAPATAGRPYALLQGTSGDDVYLRVIEVATPDGYQAMTTHGWNAIEIIVEDPDQIYRTLLESPFKHIGGPAFLGEKSTIKAVQFKGPSEEVFYFTTETGDRSKSTLLTPRTAIDRPFIMVLAGTDARAITDFYIDTFGAKEAFYLKTPIGVIASAQGLSQDHQFEMGFVRLAAFSNSIEIDGYPESSTSRPIGLGDLPAGVSITSFSVHSLDAIDSELFIKQPSVNSSIAYNGKRSATIKGPAGELIELIEE